MTTIAEKEAFAAPDDLQLLTLDEVAAVVRVHRTTIHSLRQQNLFPQPVRVGGHRVRWRLSDVRTWIESGGASPRVASGD